MTANSYAVAPFTCATIIGGCCGIRPEHIEQLHEHIGIEPERIAPSGG
ncbi:homocysteine S-methyltransferase family protein [Pseudomonas fulva]